MAIFFYLKSYKHSVCEVRNFQLKIFLNTYIVANKFNLYFKTNQFQRFFLMKTSNPTMSFKVNTKIIKYIVVLQISLT